jgi:hypothetical protein
MSSHYDIFELEGPSFVTEADGSRRPWLAVWCRPCNEIIWEPLGRGDRLEAITDACDEHICQPVPQRGKA